MQPDVDPIEEGDYVVLVENEVLEPGFDVDSKALLKGNKVGSVGESGDFGIFGDHAHAEVQQRH